MTHINISKIILVLRLFPAVSNTIREFDSVKLNNTYFLYKKLLNNTDYYVKYYMHMIIRVVNDTQSQSFETVSNAKIKVLKQYQMLKLKFRNSVK